jgi:hypothetical protein
VSLPGALRNNSTTPLQEDEEDITAVTLRAAVLSSDSLDIYFQCLSPFSYESAEFSEVKRHFQDHRASKKQRRALSLLENFIKKENWRGLQNGWEHWE